MFIDFQKYFSLAHFVDFLTGTLTISTPYFASLHYVVKYNIIGTKRFGTKRALQSSDQRRSE